MKFILSTLMVLFSLNLTFSQKVSEKGSLPYYQIPDYPEAYTPENVAARLIDGLGYRYFWATEGLTEKDLEYRISEDSRTTLETLGHIMGLSRSIALTVKKEPISSAPDRPELSFAEKRQATLENIKQASDLLKSSGPGGLEEMMIVFKRGERTSEFPFWNLLNGMIADAIYHTGQIVSYRRASGNPINPKVSVFSGKTRE